MKIKHIAFAAAAFIASSAFAAPSSPSYLSGSSASQPTVIKALASLCSDAAGNFAVYKSATSYYKLENILTYTCSVPFSAASGVDVVYHNVNGGSLNSVIWPILNTPVTYADPTNDSCALVTSGSSSDILSPYTVYQGCHSLTAQSEGGFSDTEPSIATTYLSSIGVDLSGVRTKSANSLQTFGVAVSDDLYVLLYKAQYGINIPAADCPDATTATNDQITQTYYITQCQPSVSRAEMASIMSGTAFVKGLGIRVFNDVTTSARLTYCRGSVTSGEQNVAQNYFLANPASSSGLPVIGGDTSMANASSKIEQLYFGVHFNVLAGSGTGDTLNCIGGRNQDTTPGVDGTIQAGSAVYRIGVVSGTRLATSRYLEPTTYAVGNWKFVRLSEAPFTEGTNSALNVARAKAGRYDLISEVRYNTEAGVTTAGTIQLLSDIAGNVTGHSYPGLYKIQATSGWTPGSFNHAGSDSKAPLVH